MKKIQGNADHILFRINQWIKKILFSQLKTQNALILRRH